MTDPLQILGLWDLNQRSAWDANLAPLLAGPFPSMVIGGYIHPHAELVQTAHKKGISITAWQESHRLAQTFEAFLRQWASQERVLLRIVPAWVLPGEQWDYHPLDDDCGAWSSNELCGGCGRCLSMQYGGVQRLLYHAYRPQPPPTVAFPPHLHAPEEFETRFRVDDDRTLGEDEAPTKYK